MLIAQENRTIKAKPSDIWSFYADVASWKTWDKDVEKSNIDGPFKQGVTGNLKVPGGPNFKFLISKLEEDRVFVCDSFLPLAKMIFTHELEETTLGTKITHTVELKGLLSPLFYLFLAKKIRDGLGPAIEKLIQLADK